MNYKTLSFLLICSLFVVGVFAQELQTPLEKSDFKKLSTYDEIISFLNEAKKLNPEIDFQYIGKSVSGRNIPVVHISSADQTTNPKIKMLIMGQTHGNEPSGKEGLLLLISSFANKKNSELLKNIDLYIVPQLNSDGGEKHARKNANNTDLNRNHLILTQPETQHLHLFFDKILPEVTVDFHEYYPFGDTTAQFRYEKNTDIQFGTNTNINIEPAIIQFSQEKILPFVLNYIQQKNYTSKEYMVGSLIEDKYIRNSTVDINDGRQSFGILNTFSFIFEGLNGRTPLERIERRAKSQFQAAMSIIEFTAQNKAIMLETVQNGRKKLISGTANDSVFIQLDHYKSNKSHTLHMFSLVTRKDTLYTTDEFYTTIKSIFQVQRPVGYLIPVNDELLMGFLKKHQIEFSPYQPNAQFKIMQYKLDSKNKITLEGDQVYNPETSILEVKKISGSYVFVSLNQLKSNLLVIAFEPKSTLNLANYKEYEYLIKSDKKYRILRLEKKN